MSKIKCFIAMSLDGFIAREDGRVDWLDPYHRSSQTDHGYGKFIAEIDTTIMGRETYEKIISIPVDFPYLGLKNYVVTHNKNFLVRSPDTYLIHDMDDSTLSRLRGLSNKNIWLVGGSHLIGQFLRNQRVDEMIVSVVPVLLGQGIRLFDVHPNQEQHWSLLSSEAFKTGIVSLHYTSSSGSIRER